ncbi:unnamed protein product [Paramecium sonneborni]|uniref:WD40-repeat-containing domain n=1 Tax=Paramecium sonneborni TaxID=65129 RepID=A0A8S1MDH9_9CILI|nr:unnamed protein product [Paramecium sonneborni]
MQEWQMKEEPESLVCCKHQAQIKYVLTNKGLIGKDKLKCQYCLEEKHNPQQLYTITQAIVKIQNNKNDEYVEQQRIIKDNLMTLYDHIEGITKFRQDALQFINGIQDALNNYKEELKQGLNISKTFSFFQELDFIETSPQILKIRQDAHQNIQNLRHKYSEKIVKNIYNLQNLISSNYELNQLIQMFNKRTDVQLSPIKVQNYMNSQMRNLEKIEFKQGLIPEIIFKGKNSEIIDAYKPLYHQKEKIISSKLKQIWPHLDKCQAISFNYDDSIFAAACNREINLWKLQDGTIINLIDTLQDHSQEIQTLIFSKQKNWLFSAGKDRSIILWKPIRVFTFNLFNFFNKKQQQLNAHQDSIIQLILDETENQLISCSSDNQISIWNVNYQRNSIQFEYSLQRHKRPVISISLSQNNNLLVSSGLDKQIIVWQLDKNKKWKFKQVIEQSEKDFGCRLSFISNDIIIWQSFKLGVTNISKEENGLFKELPNSRLDLAKNEENDGDYSFPSIFNYEKQLLIQKYHKSIYFITLNYQNNLKVQEEQIIFDDEQFCGNLSNDGKYFAVWSQQKFNIYEIFEQE